MNWTSSESHNQFSCPIQMNSEQASAGTWPHQTMPLSLGSMMMALYEALDDVQS